MAKQEKLLSVGTTAANIVLAGTGVLCFAAFLYFVYLYGWTGQRKLTSWMSVLLYYVIPAILAFLLFASLRVRKPLRINLALCIFSAGVSIYMLETLLTVWSNLPTVTQELARKKRAAAAKAFGIDFDARSKTQVVDDLRAQGIDAVLSIFPQALLKRQDDETEKSVVAINGAEVLPLAGIANKVVVVCNEGGQFLTYQSDQHGFNNPRDGWAEGTVDIVPVGDSFVQGWCVPPDENFVAIIRKRYPATLNLGMEGGGPLTMLATIKEYARNARPKVVLWFYYEGNDLADLRRERNSLLIRYLTEGFSQGLPARQSEIDRALDEHIKTAREEKFTVLKEIIAHLGKLPTKTTSIIALRALRDRVGLVQRTVERQTRNAESGPLSKTSEPGIELLGKILTHAKETVSGWGGVVYFVYLPGYLRYAPENVGFNRDRILQAARDAGLPIVDLHPTFAAQKDPLDLFALRLHSHYTQLGHRLVAEKVLGSISLGK